MRLKTLRKNLKRLPILSMNEKIDVQSLYSEGDLEYVTQEDSYQVLQSFDSWHEYNHERNEE